MLPERNALGVKIKKLRSWFSLPELGLWTWPMWWYKHHDPRNDDERDIKAIQFAIEKWITHFDTAELYWTWSAEKILWKAIKNYKRETLQIASKVRGSNCSYKAIKMACNNSLKRLEIKYLDLYYIHWREKQFDLQDCIKAMDELVEEWLIKNIGVSNFSVESLKEAQSYTKNKIVANQVHYNLIYREPENHPQPLPQGTLSWLPESIHLVLAKEGGESLLEYCQKNDILLVAFRPIELWKLANTGTSQLVEASIKYQKTHAQVAINYLVSQKNVVTIFNSSDTKHILENMWWIGWNIGKEDFENLRDNFSSMVHKTDLLPLN